MMMMLLTIAMSAADRRRMRSLSTKRTLSRNHEHNTVEYTIQDTAYSIETDTNQIVKWQKTTKKMLQKDARENGVQSNGSKKSEKLFQWLSYFIIISFKALNWCREHFSCSNSFTHTHTYQHIHMHWTYTSTIIIVILTVVLACLCIASPLALSLSLRYITVVIPCCFGRFLMCVLCMFRFYSDSRGVCNKFVMIL